MLGAALCCSALLDSDKKCWENNRAFLLFWRCCALLGEMLDSFDHSIELAQFHKIPGMYT